MKQNITTKTLILAAAVSLGLVTTASAQSANVAVPTPTQETAAGGLLGTRYTGVDYTYYDMNGTGPNHAHGFGVVYNQPINANFDFTANYDWARAKYAGARFTQQDLALGAVAYTNLAWGKPFALVSAGWEWGKGGGLSDDSFRYQVGVGTEFQVAPAVVVTPYVVFARATGFNDSEFDFGVKAAYRVTRDWDVFAKVQYDAVRHSDDLTEYSAGLNYHF